MKKVILGIVIGIVPFFLYSQVSDLTISPDSLFYDNALYNTTILTNNSIQPINLLSVQQECFACVGNWYWKVDTMSVITPHWIYPGQSVSVVVMAWGGIKSTLNDYKHSTMAIQSSVGLQYCHIFLNSSLISDVEENSQMKLNIYPNPAQSDITIEFQDNSGALKIIEILNSFGGLVFTDKACGSSYNLCIGSFPQGIYIVKIHATKNCIISRFIKD
jgi:hypothetical protein